MPSEKIDPSLNSSQVMELASDCQNSKVRFLFSRDSMHFVLPRTDKQPVIMCALESILSKCSASSDKVVLYH